MILNSYAKLNLYLEVLNKRRDNYHNLRTIFERISLCDRIILESLPNKKIKIKCSSPEVPSDHSNLAYRSAALLQDELKVDKGVDINIIKRIPVGSGLGGGSSNAAFTLIGLNKLWKLNLKQDRLVVLARQIGADVPFFIYNCPFALGEGRGDKIKPMKSLKDVKLWHILIVPGIKVPTVSIYRQWDKERLALTRPKNSVKLLTSGLKEKDFSLIGKTLFNSLEVVTTKLYPELTLIKEKLSYLGPKSILMSGSGPAIFGIVSSRKEAVSVCTQLKREHAGWSIFVTRTI